MRNALIIDLLAVTSILFSQNLLNQPQKIVIDTEHNRLLVSNYGNGALVQIDIGGNQSYFAEDAGFIDGMAISGNYVYGAGSNRTLIAYDLDTGWEMMSLSFDGPSNQYLSSVTADDNGYLYISSPPAHAIYKFRTSDTAYWTFAEGNGLNRPNGILYEPENDRLVVIDDSPGTSIIHAISLSDSTVSTLTTTNLNYPDGIVRDNQGTYYIGGYYLDGLYRVDAGFANPPELFFQGSHMVYPTYDPSNNSLLVTYYMDDDWERIYLDTAINDETTPQHDFNLSNHPNPFNPDTTIRYSVADNSPISICIYNLRGQLVRTLIEKAIATGEHEVTWHGDDDNGNDCASGVYLYRLQTPDKTSYKKMLLLK